MSLVLPILFSISCYLQDTPGDLSKAEVPKIAHCVVCESNGEGQKEEKILAGVRYKGGVYYFCNVREADEFKKDPEAFLPPILPRPAPGFNGATLEGKPISSSDLAGEVILVDFLAPFCVPFVKGM